MNARACSIAAALLLCASCARLPGPPLSQASLELQDTPFFPQQTDLCGPAALTTVLQASGVATDFDAVAGRVYLPKRGGSLQIELVGASRSFDRLPVRVAPNIEAILAQLKAERPVLVLQNLGVQWLPRWHYAVVVGYIAERDSLVLRSGPHKRHRVDRRRFLRTWARSDYWAIALFRASDPVVGVDARAYLAEAAAMESLGRFEVARNAYEQALARWPGESAARLGVANSLLGLGDRVGARVAYRALLDDEPANVAARNNLAHVSAELGCVDEALGLLSAAPEAARADPLYPMLTATRIEIESATGSKACVR